MSRPVTERPRKPEVHVGYRGGRVPRSEYDALSSRQRQRARMSRLLEPLVLATVWIWICTLLCI